MANSLKGISTSIALFMLFMAIAIFCLGGISIDLWQKNRQLKADVQQLQSTQVLLMVPDEQAQSIANWLTEHPEQMKAMLTLKAPGEQKSVVIGPGAAQMPDDGIASSTTADVPATLRRTSTAETTPEPAQLSPLIEIDNTELENKANANESIQNLTPNATLGSTARAMTPLPVVISENADGVKVISLPNGGIRVTTRENQ